MGSNEVVCPLVDRSIDISDCIENIDCIDGFIVLSSLPEEYRQKNNYIEICKNCKYHDIN